MDYYEFHNLFNIVKNREKYVTINSYLCTMFLVYANCYELYPGFIVCVYCVSKRCAI